MILELILQRWARTMRNILVALIEMIMSMHGSFVKNSSDVFDNNVDVKCADERTVINDIEKEVDTIMVDEDYVKYLDSIDRNDHVYGSFVENYGDVFDNNVDVKCADERTVINDIEEEVDQDYVKLRAYGSDFGDNTGGVELFDVVDHNVHIKPSADCNTNQTSMPCYNGDSQQRTLSNSIQVDQSLYDKCWQKYISSLVSHTNFCDDGGSVRSVDVDLADVNAEPVDRNNVDAKSIDSSLDEDMDPNYKSFWKI